MGTELVVVDRVEVVRDHVANIGLEMGIPPLSKPFRVPSSPGSPQSTRAWIQPNLSAKMTTRAPCTTSGRAAPVPSILFLTFLLFMLTNHSGDEFLARSQYQDAMQSLQYQLSNFTAWMDGKSSNFTLVGLAYPWNKIYS